VRKKEREVLKVTILQKLKTNARTNRRERPKQFATGLVLIISGTLGIVVYAVYHLAAMLTR
jgi:hypothetical protein